MNTIETSTTVLLQKVAAGSEVTTPGEPAVASLPAAPSLPQEAGAAPSSSIVPPPTLEPHLDEGQELFRLFVGNVPKAYQESDLRPLFDQYGSIKQVTVLLDSDGASRGCAFVLFHRREDAEAAIAALDKKLTLPGQAQPMEVRFARKPALVEPGMGPQDNRQLFFSGGPPGVTRQDVTQLFSAYGKVEHVHLFMDFRTSSSKGCGFVTLDTRKGAEEAMQALDQQHTMPGARMVLTVKWADPGLQERKRKAAEGLAEDQRQLFVAKVLKSSPEEDVQALFSHYGTVEKVSMFKPAFDATYHKGCGVVTMAKREEAEAALGALDETYVWPGMEEPLVVKWMDPNLSKRKRAEPMPVPISSEPPPPGCDADAMKLYVGNIPTSYSVDDIRHVFKQFGRVIQILIARDKETHQPKGSAFIWFQRRREAELAQKRLNGSATAMPDPSTPQAKPLMVTAAQQSRVQQVPPPYGGRRFGGGSQLGGRGPGGGRGAGAPGRGGQSGGGRGGQRFGGGHLPMQRAAHSQQMQRGAPQRVHMPPAAVAPGGAGVREGGGEVWDQAYGPASFDPNAYYEPASYVPPASGRAGIGAGDLAGGGYSVQVLQQPVSLAPQQALSYPPAGMGAVQAVQTAGGLYIMQQQQQQPQPGVVVGNAMTGSAAPAGPSALPPQPAYVVAQDQGGGYGGYGAAGGGGGGGYPNGVSQGGGYGGYAAAPVQGFSQGAGGGQYAMQPESTLQQGVGVAQQAQQLQYGQQPQYGQQAMPPGQQPYGQQGMAQQGMYSQQHALPAQGGVAQTYGMYPSPQQQQQGAGGYMGYTQ